MDVEQPEPPRTEPKTGESPETSQPAYDRFVEGQAALDQELGDPPAPVDSVEETRPSRKSAWLAMGAVALALGLLWIAPGVDEQDSSQEPLIVSGDGESGEDPDAVTDALAK